MSSKQIGSEVRPCFKELKPNQTKLKQNNNKKYLTNLLRYNLGVTKHLFEFVYSLISFNKHPSCESSTPTEPPPPHLHADIIHFLSPYFKIILFWFSSRQGFSVVLMPVLELAIVDQASLKLCIEAF